MLEKLLRKIFGDKSTRDLNLYSPQVEAINLIFEGLHQYDDDQLRERVADIRGEIAEKLRDLRETLDDLERRFREEAEESERNRIDNRIDETRKQLKALTKSTLDDYLPEVFALVKETCRRLVDQEFEVRGHMLKWNMVPFDVQLIGGMALHDGKIAEMATGEGKTLVATLPLFLNALVGRGVHLVTVNDYLASRDAEWMSPVFNFHGMKVGCITTGMSFEERKEAYLCDVTYGMNSEFGFDYLRDNMAVSPQQLVQRDFYYAIVDEVDSILIDEARTPLIISGPIAQDKNFYPELRPQINQLVQSQNSMVQRVLSEIREDIREDNPAADMDRLATNLLIVQRAAPRNKAFAKLMQESWLKKLVNDMEGIYLRDKRMHELDEKLFYVVEERQNSVDLCEKGRELLSRHEKNLFVVESLDDVLNRVDEDESLSEADRIKRKTLETNRFMDKSEKLHNINQLLKAYTLFENDKEYVVIDNKVIIVDEFTGRQMPGRRFSDGLHQALEAKENVTIEAGTQTFATITLQNYFRMFERLSGMTGTAVTEEAEFIEIYNLPVMTIPTNVPVTRVDHEDVIYMTKNEKYQALMDEIIYWHELQKPVLVGTVSVEVSETISRLLRRRNIPHSVLNARQHQREAEIITSAGKPGSVTIATNMAGRGTDIKLGPGVVTQSTENYRGIDSAVTDGFPYGQPLDGLHVIGSERHESRRIDRQLRGRAGRQGDPGTSRFYLSLEDDLMRLFGGDRIAPMMMKMGIKPGDAIRHPWMTKTVERAQKRVEEHNFEIRKNLIKYDEVMNQQREVIYSYRRSVLKGFSLKREVQEMVAEAVLRVVDEHTSASSYSEDWDLQRLCVWFRNNLNVAIDPDELQSDHLTRSMLEDILRELVMQAYEKKEAQVGEEMMRDIERRSVLEVVDDEWRDHLHEMDLLKESVHLRSYAQKDPLVEYKRESYELFENLISRIQDNVTKKVFTTYILSQEQMESMLNKAKTQHEDMSAFIQDQTLQVSQNASEPPQFSGPYGGEAAKPRPVHVAPKVGRNDPCPCGSGKKYKNCCGRFADSE
ncbi:MAG TPA: preprotein translocase subunit SecA [Candidatus Syntrophosphaera sp.]|jgi:preprotein translocase subunit SecA|nr:preprotein translocase subunit SecA [Candidatus Cloacimonadota bacterium]OQB91766.1 MAG: preprotein translocase subunit SecA [Candidatus Cloacimonetes bacterium ADurb.Bin117]HNU54785.1 preprotein translocase subunit SecA [Candidatus Syntrophosphaera sp.]MDI9524980.1 preprotein translocase subunit SecA [Candidatus Cloacimonadota bacterium]HOH48791.1 preprotein translocase subunit SecA [Candidatus Syntrophosphaera sp.]